MDHELSRPAFDRLQAWCDPVARSGPDNMAVDELLLDSLDECPVLRIYDWDGPWVSLGYFQVLSEARALFPGPGVQFVRRMTGGGIVDHRIDLTYTLAVPRGHPLAEARGNESYRVIHAAVAAALGAAGIAARLLREDDQTDSAACFDKGVAWDVAGADGRKLAGAGQKRSRAGLLHQGSILAAGLPAEFAESLPGRFAATTTAWEPAREVLARAGNLAASRYGAPEWRGRR